MITLSFKVLIGVTWLTIQRNKTEILGPVTGPSFSHFPCSSWRQRKLSDTSLRPFGTQSPAVPLCLHGFNSTFAGPYWCGGKCIKICTWFVVSLICAWEVRPSFRNSLDLMENWSFLLTLSQGLGSGVSSRNAHIFSESRKIIC